MDFDAMKLGIVTLTVGNWGLMDGHMSSIMDYYPHDKCIYIVPNLDFDLSLSAAINLGFRRAVNEGCDYIIYSADDTVIGRDCFQTVLTKLVEEDLWFCGGQSLNSPSSGWDVFAINPVILERVGYWDEGFYPAYFEDNDWAHRISLADESKAGYIPADFVHLGSQTVRNMNDGARRRHSIYFEANRERYVAKWGGLPKQETFFVPWNGGEPDTNYDPKVRYGRFIA
jgi:GT2 family glycosyltransferase